MSQLVIAASYTLGEIVDAAVEARQWPDADALLELRDRIRAEADVDDLRAFLMAQGIDALRQVSVLRSCGLKADATDTVAWALINEAVSPD